jgi:hypothetical protein
LSTGSSVELYTGVALSVWLIVTVHCFWMMCCCNSMLFVQSNLLSQPKSHKSKYFLFFASVLRLRLFVSFLVALVSLFCGIFREQKSILLPVAATSTTGFGGLPLGPSCCLVDLDGEGDAMAEN